MYIRKSLKSLLISLLFAYNTIAVFAFVNIPKSINKTVNKTDNKEGIRFPSTRKSFVSANISRQELCELIGSFPFPFIPLKCKKCEKTQESLELPESLDSPNVPELRKDITIGDKLRSLDVTRDLEQDIENYTDTSTSVSTKTKAVIDVLLGNIMDNLKQNGVNAPELSIKNLQKYCSTTNIIKNKNPKILTLSFQYGKYSLLLGVFSDYEVIEYTKRIVNKTKYYDIDMKVNAPYKTMLQEGIQFNEMYYPKNRYSNNICHVIYRWSLIKEDDGKIYVESCYLVPPLKS